MTNLQAHHAMELIAITQPPSANKLWKRVLGRGGRAPSKEYRDWLVMAQTELRLQDARPVHGAVVIVMNVERGSALSDIDNRIKPTLDLLVKSGLIDDDRYVAAVAASWVKKGFRADRHDPQLSLAIVPAQAMTIYFGWNWRGGTDAGFFIRTESQEKEAI